MRAALALVALLAMADRGSAQVSGDSAAVASALVRFVLSHPAAGGEAATVAGVAVDSGRTQWGKYVDSVLQVSMLPGDTRQSDTARYYAMRVRMDSVSIGAAAATAWATWSQCIKSRLGQSMNFWVHPVAYALVKSDSGWVATGQRILVFMDGSCSAFRGRP
jgi:hypothetical protein